MIIILSLIVIILVFGSATVLMLRHDYLPSPLSIEEKGVLDNKIITTQTKPTEIFGTIPQPGSINIQKSKTYALIIGANIYQNSSLNTLGFIKNDTIRIAKALRNHYSLENLVLLTGEQASRHIITEKINDILNVVTENDIVILYYAGHGLQSRDRDDEITYFGTYDTNPDRLENTSISSIEFQKILSSEVAGRMLLILDTCYPETISNKSHGLSSSTLSRIYSNQPNRAIMTSIVSQSIKPGSNRTYQHLFARYLVEGLNESAIQETNLVRLRDLYYYISKKFIIKDLQIEPILHTISIDNFPLLLPKPSESKKS